MKLGQITMRLFYSVLKSCSFKNNVSLMSNLVTMSKESSLPNEKLAIFDRKQFERTVSATCVILKNAKDVSEILPIFKPFLLKYKKFHSIAEENGETVIYLDEKLLESKNVSLKDCVDDCSKQKNVDVQMATKSISLTYDNFSVENLFKEILPKDETWSSYSMIGHIVHINLREHLSDYRFQLAQVLLDKVAGCKTVVNKSDIIENQFRNLTFELLAGEANYVTRVRENGLSYEIDFSKVFWNSRLSTEHDRLVKTFKICDFVYDCFAGVGPFAIPAAVKRKCKVVANDLNPDCVFYLAKNVGLNKVKNVEVQNLDAAEFLDNFVPKHLVRCIQNETILKGVNNVHFVMNLPAIATDFLRYFVGLLAEKRTQVVLEPNCVPDLYVHCYTFSKGADDDIAEVENKVEKIFSGRKLDELHVHFVRNVAPSKNMMRASFRLTPEIIFDT